MTSFLDLEEEIIYEKGRPGMLVDTNNRAIETMSASRVDGTYIKFPAGVPVCADIANSSNASHVRPGAHIKGITTTYINHEYPDYTPISVLTTGNIWVQCIEDVKAGDPIGIIVSGNGIGSFIKATNADSNIWTGQYFDSDLKAGELFVMHVYNGIKPLALTETTVVERSEGGGDTPQAHAGNLVDANGQPLNA